MPKLTCISKLYRLNPGSPTNPCLSKELKNPTCPSSRKHRSLPRKNPKLFHISAVAEVLLLEAQREHEDPAGQDIHRHWGSMKQISWTAPEEEQGTEEQTCLPCLPAGLALHHGKDTTSTLKITVTFLSFLNRWVPGNNEKSRNYHGAFCIPLTGLKLFSS